MCGIAGIIAGPGRIAEPSELKSLSEALIHRGPDDEGVCGWSPASSLIHARTAEELAPCQVGFAHRRLSIIDTGPGGHQPMATPDGRHVLVTNGEIYNYVELRRELEASGITFRSTSDTEVLLHALVTWGIEKTLPRLVGMFAFAFLDTETRRLVLARDPFGIKPLLWTMRDGDLIFASEPNAILRLAGISRQVDPQATYDYLRFGMTDRGDRTLFGAIKHLPPASFAVVNLDAPAAPVPKAYWQPSITQTSNLTFDDAASELRRLFLKSVGLHLRADVPVGAALSGGIDSSAVVAAMRQLEGDDLDLHTFSFTAPGDPIDEEAWADMAGTAAQATMHKVTATGRTLSQQIDALIERQGEPFGSTSIFAQDQVYRLVKRTGIKVTVDGQGADEILAGYLPFLGTRIASLLSRGRVPAALQLTGAAADQMSAPGLLARAARHLLPTGLQSIGRWATGEELVPAWMDRAWLEARSVQAVAPQGRHGSRVLMGDLATSLNDRVLPSLLRYQDRNAMAHSVESRVPFLTTEIVDFVYSLPEDFLISDEAQTKSVFRAAMRGLVPDAILNRRDKIGFITPEDDWLRASDGWLAKALASDRARTIPAFAQVPFRRAISVALGSNKPLGSEVWRWANFIRWSEIFDVSFAA